jgi:hypothetical protein
MAIKKPIFKGPAASHHLANESANRTMLHALTSDVIEMRTLPQRSPGRVYCIHHYSLLATVEAIFNLGTLGRNDTSATPMSDLFRGGIP